MILLALAMLCCIVATAAQKSYQSPDAAYNSGDYQEAIVMYEKALKSNANPADYHNLGNAYYRVGNIPMAVLNYEKALKLAPSDNAVRHSLEIARSKTMDHMPPESEMFFVQWYRAFVSINGIDTWATYAICALVVSLMTFLAFLFVSAVRFRRIAFYTSAVMLLAFILCNICAWQRKQYVTQHDSAIILSPTVSVKSSPTQKSTDACLIHEGTWVRITDAEMKDWYGIRLSDGREGWILRKDAAEI